MGRENDKRRTRAGVKVGERFFLRRCVFWLLRLQYSISSDVDRKWTGVMGDLLEIRKSLIDGRRVYLTTV